MGWWLNDAPGHEGFLVAVVQQDGHFRELSYPHDDAEQPQAVTMVQAACDCGFRSERRPAPLGTTYVPFVVRLPSSFHGQRVEQWARDVWQEHVLSCAARQSARLK